MPGTVAEHTITCKECGRPYETKRSNTKLCSLCRLIVDMQFVAKRTRECEICDEEFAPINRADVECPGCSYQPKRYGITQCARCGKKGNRIHPDVNICYPCTRDPEFRTDLRKALNEKRTKLVKEAA